MLYPQIPQNFLKNISTEFGINLGILSVNLKERKDNLSWQQTARYDKLRIVTNYIKNNFPVGSVDEPDDYFEGTLSMSYLEIPDKNIALFVGKTGEISLALTGSAYHMVGSIRQSSMSSSGSKVYLGSIFDDLQEALRRIDKNDKSKLNSTMNIESIIPLMKGPEQKLEFLARKLYEKRVPDKEDILIGSPIYVSLAE
jgi:hypothetical protein